MTQSIVVQVGQCGNQIGCRFWDLALREHAAHNKKGIYDESLSSFFRNVDSRYTNPLDIGIGEGKNKISSLKARAVLVDMEEGVVNELLSGSLRDVFDHQQLLTDVSGCGNNWAVGHKLYGSQYQEQLKETIRVATEHCDCLQCFFLIHSMGGGTGSGVGTAILGLLEDEYPDVYRFVTAVYPSADDDVITSPYNSVLAMKQLTDHADCVMPVENQALIDICQKILMGQSNGTVGKRTYPVVPAGAKKKTQRISGSNSVSKDDKPFDAMNDVVANLLLNLTRLDQMFSDAFSRENQLIKADPRNGLYVACGLICRGKVEISDIRRNIDRLRPSLKFISWNTDGWKTGLCSVAPVGHPFSLLTLANNTCLRHNFRELKDRFVKLYRRKAHIHHYTGVDGMDTELFAQSLESVECLIEEYQQLDINQPATTPRLEVAC